MGKSAGPGRTSHIGQQLAGLGPDLASVDSKLLTHAACWGCWRSPQPHPWPPPIASPPPQPRQVDSLVPAQPSSCCVTQANCPTSLGLSPFALRGVGIALWLQWQVGGWGRGQNKMSQPAGLSPSLSLSCRLLWLRGAQVVGQRHVADGSSAHSPVRWVLGQLFGVPLG